VTIKNLSASVRARLKNKARTTNRPFQEILQYYAMERFLYRLSRSSYCDRFILKGALMLRVWKAPIARPTKDVDFLGHVDNSITTLVRLFREVCSNQFEPDGMTFDPETMTGEAIKEDADYQSVRIRFLGFLENARVHMQIDIGFGDVVVPGPLEIVYPTLLDLPAPRLHGYSRESIIAEKFHAMVLLGTLNSRMKDFYDIWLLARQFDYDGPTLVSAVKTTFHNRATEIELFPAALTPEFAATETAKRNWTAFLRKGKLALAPPNFDGVASYVLGFLQPVARAVQNDVPFDIPWKAPGPWRKQISSE
jgi:hypothetical protein